MGRGNGRLNDALAKDEERRVTTRPGHHPQSIQGVAGLLQYKRRSSIVFERCEIRIGFVEALGFRKDEVKRIGDLQFQISCAGRRLFRICATSRNHPGTENDNQPNRRISPPSNRCFQRAVEPLRNPATRRIKPPSRASAGGHALLSGPAPVRPIIARNSRRVELFERKAPSMRLVTMAAPGLCTPRVVMH